MGPLSYALLALALHPAAGARQWPRLSEVPGSVLVRAADSLPGPALLGTVAGARLQRVLAGGVLQLALGDPSAAATAQLLSRLRRLPGVAWAEAEHFRYGQQAPVNDPRYGEQWALPLIQLPQAWQRTHGSPHVVVAVIDTGMRPHPELAARLVPGYDFITDPQSADDGDGCDADPTDTGALVAGSSGLHGLHVSGILGAQANNQTGIAGIDWNCRILPIRVLGVRGAAGRDSDIAEAIRWAAGLPVAGVPDNQTPAAIINLSFGGPGGSQLLQEAVAAAVARGAVVVASAGNDATDVASYAPAGLDQVIAVGAAHELGGLAGYSNFGPRIDLLAPGGGLTDLPDSGILSTMYLPAQRSPWDYLVLPGTSQAAAHVSGVAALLRAMAPQLTPEQIRQLLVATADPRGRCPQGCGAGLLDAAAAAQATADQAGCAPQCGLHEECIDHACVPFTPVEILPGGCSASGRPGGAAAWVLLLLAALAALGRLVRPRPATASPGPPTAAAARHPAPGR